MEFRGSGRSCIGVYISVSLSEAGDENRVKKVSRKA